MRIPHTATRVARVRHNQRMPGHSNEDSVQPKRKKKEKAIRGMCFTFTVPERWVTVRADNRLHKSLKGIAGQCDVHRGH